MSEALTDAALVFAVLSNACWTWAGAPSLKKPELASMLAVLFMMASLLALLDWSGP